MLFPQMLFRRCQKTKDLLTAEEREGGGGGGVFIRFGRVGDREREGVWVGKNTKK